MIRSIPTLASTYRPYTGGSGIYVSRKLSEFSVNKLVDFVHRSRLCAMSDLDIADLHATVIWSPVDVKTKPAPNFQSVAAYCTRIEFWPGHNEDGYLVAILNSPGLVELNKSWCLQGARNSFQPYQPHITLKTPFAVNQPKQFQVLLDVVRTRLESSPMLLRLESESIQNAKIL